VILWSGGLGVAMRGDDEIYGSLFSYIAAAGLLVGALGAAVDGRALAGGR
jgi:hypothetical protein